MQIFIYSRKSKWTGRGDSIENQVQMCKEYIERYIEDSDKAEICVFEDEGYSGKNTKRPEFQKMIKEIKKGNCKYLVCYKLDRLGRNIIDLASIVEELNNLKVSFISIKENFDTSTPMGKTMLYIAGIFAQMEREQIAERVKDNMVMLARGGRWLGGNTPLGFVSEKDEKIQLDDKVRTSYILKENEEEMQIVRFIFKEYIENQSLVGLVKYFLQKGILTKRGKEYTTTAFKDILENPVYCIADEAAYDYFENLGCQICFSREEANGKHGIIAYAKTSSTYYKNKSNPPEEWIIAIGKHKGEVTGKNFVKIQRILEANKIKSESFHKVKNEVALLSGLVYCTCGHVMRPKYYNVKQVMDNGDRKFSYICKYREYTHGEKCSVVNAPGNDLDRLVCEEVLKYSEPDSSVGKMLRDLEKRLEDSKGSSVTELDMLKQNLSDKQKAMDNLVSSLKDAERSPAFVEHVDGELSKLNEECRVLNKRIEEINRNHDKVDYDKTQVNLLASELASFARLFEHLSVAKKREYLKLLIDRVVWDGENAHIFIYGSH